MSLQLYEFVDGTKHDWRLVIGMCVVGHHERGVEYAQHRRLDHAFPLIIYSHYTDSTSHALSVLQLALRVLRKY